MTSGKEISVGDVVQLRGGGPWMTVDRIEAEQAVCMWREGELLRREAFPLSDLMFPDINEDGELLS